MGFFDLYNWIHHEKIQQEYSPSARVLIDTLIGEFNSARWIDELAFSERGLVQITGLKKSTLHDAKHFLTSRNIIKCKSFKNKTAYSLGDDLKALLNRPVADQSPTTNRPVTDQQATINRPVSDQSPTALANSNIRVREDLKTLDSRHSSTSTSACACADGRAFNWNSEIEEFLTEQWLNNRGVPVSVELLSYFKALVEKHGFDWTKAIIHEAGDAYGGNYSMPIKWLRDCVKRKLEGGEKSGKSKQHPAVADTSGYDFKPVESTISDEEGDRIYAELLRLDAEKRRKRGLA